MQIKDNMQPTKKMKIPAMQLWLANHIFPAFQQGLSKIISNKGFRQNYFNVKKTESDANTTSKFVSN